MDQLDNIKIGFQKQLSWFNSLYGFNNEKDFQKFLRSKKVIIDAGCGLGYKSSWMAELAPESIVIGIDISDVVYIAKEKYCSLKNLYFMQGDIADTHIKRNTTDFILCDQVIHHTENPENTFKHLSELLKSNGVFACYVYAKKALPRELIDDFFRTHSHDLSMDELWDLSDQLTVLGKNLSELNVEIDCPEIPLLQIKAGKYDIQRFIYWNFLKCFWDKERGFDLSKSVNFDWYAPSNARRYSKSEFERMIDAEKLKIDYFHEEEACYSGRFSR